MELTWLNGLNYEETINSDSGVFPPHYPLKAETSSLEDHVLLIKSISSRFKSNILSCYVRQSVKKNEVLGIQVKVLHILGNCSTTKLHLQSAF